MNQELISLLTLEIKKKSQIESLENKFIEEKLNQYFLTNGNIRKQLEKEFNNKKSKIIKSKLFKEILKNIREELGQVYGQFLTNQFKKKEKILENNNTEELLMIHKSTRERINYYNTIYEQIFEWHKPKYIADLCCGMNPLSYNLMKIKPEYFSSDLNPKDMEFLKSFFKKNNIKGTAIASDISSLEIINNPELKKADLVFLFKALDSLETVHKNISKDLLEKLSQKKIVVSFPTKSLISKKTIKENKRNWFNKFLKEKEWNYKTFEVENEYFYLISKN